MNLTRHLAATYAHLEPRDIEAARAIVRRKRRALVIAAALRALWSPSRIGRGGEPNPTANLLSNADRQIQGAARLIAEALKKEAL